MICLTLIWIRTIWIPWNLEWTCRPNRVHRVRRDPRPMSNSKWCLEVLNNDMSNILSFNWKIKGLKQIITWLTYNSSVGKQTGTSRRWSRKREILAYFKILPLFLKRSFRSRGLLVKGMNSQIFQPLNMWWVPKITILDLTAAAVLVWYHHLWAPWAHNTLAQSKQSTSQINLERDMCLPNN